jgi:large subunit ribosomal protein L21
MSYAIISVGGKQYRVSEGERLLVDRLAVEDGASFQPTVLLVGGESGPTIAPTDVVVTAKVLGQAKGPKIVIGKYKKRTGYKRHTGFRASLTQIEIESIGAGKGRAAAKKAEPAKVPTAPAVEAAAPAGLPEGYASMTVADVKQAAGSWSRETVEAALAYEQEHGRRKGAIAELESVLAGKEG